MKFCIVRQIGPLDCMRGTERFGRRSSVAGHRHDAEDDGRRQPGRDADQPDAEHDGGGDAGGEAPSERMNYGDVAVDRDHDERQHADADRDLLATGQLSLLPPVGWEISTGKRAVKLCGRDVDRYGLFHLWINV